MVGRREGGEGGGHRRGRREQQHTWLLSKLLNSLSRGCAEAAPRGMVLTLLEPPGAPRASLSLRARDKGSTTSVSESLRLSCLLLCEEEPGPCGSALDPRSLLGAGVAAADCPAGAMPHNFRLPRTLLHVGAGLLAVAPRLSAAAPREASSFATDPRGLGRPEEAKQESAPTT